jgi:phenylpropionate dioxygenase-like ring-hydroxylating dioxygenase large terminal subunit
MVSYPSPKKLFPYPSGWYVLLKSDELSKRQIITKRFAGSDVVAFRTESGIACVVNAYCPHMGAHFGHGGNVQGETIRCPFHHFCFDTKGECVKTGYDSKPPAKAILKTYTIRERNGFVLIWHHVKNEVPDWEVPDTDDKDWSEILTTDFLLNSHPQETTENSVDIGHFAVVHKYTDVEELSELKTEGTYLNAKYAFSRDAGFVGRVNMMRAHIDIHVHGLGYSFVEVIIPKFELLTRQYVFPCPVEDGKINLKIGMSVKKIQKPGKINFFLKLFPKSILNNLILKSAFKGYVHDVSQDFSVWQNKVYMDNPALAKGDGPIGKYRQWARQFYEGVEP